jgi:hypothetical protein
MYPDDLDCQPFVYEELKDGKTDFDKAKGGSIIYLSSSKETISVTSTNNYYRGADLSSKGGVYHVSMKMKI